MTPDYVRDEVQFAIRSLQSMVKSQFAIDWQEHLAEDFHESYTNPFGATIPNFVDAAIYEAENILEVMNPEHPDYRIIDGFAATMRKFSPKKGKG